MKKAFSFVLAFLAMLALRIPVLADAIEPPVEPVEVKSASPIIIALVVAVVIIAAVILITMLRRRRK